MNNVLAFGTGQYSLSLPVLPQDGVANTFIGNLFVSSGVEYAIIGRAPAGSAVMSLWYKGTNGLLTALTGTAPATLTTISTIAFNGAFVAAS